MEGFGFGSSLTHKLADFLGLVYLGFGSRKSYSQNFPTMFRLDFWVGSVFARSTYNYKEYNLVMPAITLIQLIRTS